MSDNRFENAPIQVVEQVNNIISKYSEFKHLLDANIIILMDLKKRVSGGKIVLGRAKKANDIEKCIYTDPDGVTQSIDFILSFDKNVFDVIDENDRERVIRHELSHCSVNEKGNFIVVPHEITDFYSEIEFNRTDPQWLDRVSTIADSIYDEQ